MPLTVWRLTAAYSLMMAGTSLLVLLAGIIGTGFAPSPDLATLPIALAVVGLAASTLPTGRLLHQFGRRPVFLAYGGIAIGSALLAMHSLQAGWFGLFCVAGFLMGWAGAAGHQYRFAALEAVPAELAPKATSLLLLGGILSAFIGPEIAVRGRNLLGTEYAGSFLLLTLSYAAGIVLIAFHRDHAPRTTAEHGPGRRPLQEILRSPVVVIAVGAAALGYGVMSLLMTATPISMHSHAGHSLDATKLVIQSHIAAMYLPSLLFAALFARLGLRGMLAAGLGVYLLCLGIAVMDTAFLNYWLALVLLGIGWNFLFLSGTNLLPYGYRPEDRFRVQAANDFLVFSVQALASLGSGWLLFHWQWHGILFACVPLLLGFAWLLFAQRHALQHLGPTGSAVADGARPAVEADQP
jgi:MFS family permease